MNWAEKEEKTRCIKLYGLLASLMRGRALQLVKAVEDSNGFHTWKSLHRALKPASMKNFMSINFTQGDFDTLRTPAKETIPLGIL